jgi:hypothetical protein
MARKSTSALLVSLLLALAMQIQAAERPPRLPQDDMEKLLEAQAKQITSMRLKFQYQAGDRKPAHVTSTWDLAGQRVNATLMYPPEKGQKPIMRTWVRNDKQEWEAYPEYADAQPGTWVVQTGPVGNLSMPRRVNDGEFGLRFLRDTLTPITVLEKEEIEQSDSNIPIQVSQRKDPQTGRTLRTYRATAEDGRTIDELTYEMDLSDGLRIYSTVQRQTIDGQTKVLYRADLSEFKKINGMWFPHQLNVQRWDLNGKLVESGKATIEQAGVNVELTPAEFVYEPPYGSRVTNRKTNFTYRAGYIDPNASVGQDLAPLPGGVGAIGAPVAPGTGDCSRY